MFLVIKKIKFWTSCNSLYVTLNKIHNFSTSRTVTTIFQTFGNFVELYFSFRKIFPRLSLKLRCDSRFQRAFTACSCVFKVITFVWANQGNYFENATWFEPTKVISLKTQLHAVNARWKRLSQRSFKARLVFFGSVINECQSDPREAISRFKWRPLTGRFYKILVVCKFLILEY